MLIINADDFGFNEQINRAIILSFKRGLCSSTTLMPNMAGFEEACCLVHENKLVNHVGMHLVLTEGYPLSEKIKHFSRFCDKEGQLRLLSGTSHVLKLGNAEKEAIAEEIRAQINRCRAHGIPITHIDSHNSIHVRRWPITSILIPIVKEQQVPYVRISRNCGHRVNLLKKWYKCIVNLRLRFAHLTRTKYFGAVEDFVFLKGKIGSTNDLKSFEVMVHPCFNDKEELLDGTNKMVLEEAIKNIDSYEEALSFSGVKYL